MPEVTATTDDGGFDRLFPAPLLEWLRRRGCRGMHPLRDGLASPPDVDWITLPLGRHDSAVTGWRFGWCADDGTPRGVLLDFLDPGDLPEDDRRALTGYLALAGPCADGVDGPAALVDRDAVATHLHDLRNAVNSLLMNAAVVTMKLPPEHRASRFVTQIPQEGERCAQLLQALAESIRPPDAPRSG
jgi:hypothetical protein